LIGGRWDLVFINIMFFAAFLFCIQVRGKKVGSWRAHGVYAGFIIALFTEMFGFPLTIYFISSYFSGTIGSSSFSFQNEFLNYMETVGMPIGLGITFCGLIFVVAGWRLIYKSRSTKSSRSSSSSLKREQEQEQQTDIVTNGIYRYIRHPQYLGFILITLGWLIHWPTIPIMWPILLFLYYKLAKKEEKEMEKTFGDRYLQYKNKVPILIPLIK
jgi:methanethiol S-methyltransferase